MSSVAEAKTKWQVIAPLLREHGRLSEKQLAALVPFTPQALSRELNRLRVHGHILEVRDRSNTRWVRLSGKHLSIKPGDGLRQVMAASIRDTEAQRKKKGGEKPTPSEEIATHVAAFLKAGGKIQKLPMGATSRPLRFDGMHAVNRASWARKEALEGEEGIDE